MLPPLVQVGGTLALLAGVLWFLGRRLHGPRTASSSTVVRLTASDFVHVVEISGRRLLIGTGAGGAPRLLCELTGATESTREEAEADVA